MNVLSLSLDPLILERESVVASRSIKYGEVLTIYTIVVPSSKKTIVILSPACTAYGTGGTSKLFQLVQMWQITKSLLQEHSYDVITSQDTYFLGFVAWLLAKKYHLGLEVQVLGIEKMSMVRKFLTKFVLTRAGSIRVLSLGLKKRLISEFGISEIRMKLVPIFVDVSSLGFRTENLSLEMRDRLTVTTESFRQKFEGRFNIISVNRLVPIKNIKMQIDTVLVLKEKYPQILLHIVGDGPLHDELKQYIENQNLTNWVILHGFKSGVELSPFFTQSDCFLLTSDFEGYGMVVIEAATAGLPIVMTDVGCAGEVILNNESGLIIPVRDTKACSVALTQILEDPMLRNQLAIGAQAAIAQLPTFDTVLDAYKASWQQALTNRY